MTFALRLYDPVQLRIYAWAQTLPTRSGVFQHTAKQLLASYLDSIGFNPSDRVLQDILVEKGLADAVPTRSTTSPRRPDAQLDAQQSLTQDQDDEFSL